MHSSGSLAVGFGSMYSFSPVQFTVAARGDVIEWQNFNGGGVKWTRYEALESSRAGVLLEEAKSAAKSEVDSECEVGFASCDARHNRSCLP